MTLKEIKTMIEQLLVYSEPERSKKISAFQQLIWRDQSINLKEDLYDILYELAVDLDYYEPNPAWRQEDISFYGEDKLVQHIQEALEAINLWEIKNKNEQKDKG